MCGIVGYVGKQKATKILIDGLEKLEYRGYDSAGVAVLSNNNIEIIKAKGKLSNLKDKVLLENLPGVVGIGHTRWATHGEPNETNAHPHQSNNRLVTLVHNGIIENYNNLKSLLLEKGYTFKSSTDTEVVANLIEYNLVSELEANEINFTNFTGVCRDNEKIIKILLTSLQKSFSLIKGTYALAIMISFIPDKIFVARKESPLILGVGKNENFIASDVPALLKFTRKVIYLDSGEIGVIGKTNFNIYNQDLMSVNKKIKTIDWDISSAEKNGFTHFMLKEIFEEPKTIKDTINSICNENGQINLEEFGLNDDILQSISNIVFIGCGSAFHVGLGLSYIFENLARIPSRAILASEFRYNEHIFDKNTLIISISQSGETADTLFGITLAKHLGLKTLSIVNVMGSSIARESDYALYTRAGMEIAVATTKAYSCQLVSGYLLALHFAKIKHQINDKFYLECLSDIKKIPELIEGLLQKQDNIKELANVIKDKRNLYMIGRGIDYAISRESSLKMKEVSYISTESFPAGELKHGTISLIETDTYVFGFITSPKTKEKTISNLMETKCRGAKIVGIGFEEDLSNRHELDYQISIPKINPLFAGSLAIIPMQLLSYYVSVSRGNDVDKPRNLAKSVTVE